MGKPELRHLQENPLSLGCHLRPTSGLGMTQEIARELFCGLEVDVHRLNSHASRSGETVPNQLSCAGEDAGAELLELRFHLHGCVFVDPASGFDIDRLSRTEGDLKYISISVQPNHAFSARSMELVDKEAGTTQQHVGDALHARERVVHLVSSSEELVLTNIQRLTLLQMLGHDVSRAIAAESDVSMPARFRQEDRQACQHALVSSPLRLDAGIRVRI